MSMAEKIRTSVKFPSSRSRKGRRHAKKLPSYQRSDTKYFAMELPILCSNLRSKKIMQGSSGVRGFTPSLKVTFFSSPPIFIGRSEHVIKAPLLVADRPKPPSPLPLPSEHFIPPGSPEAKFTPPLHAPSP
ncbi:hypothetical protein AVEN_91363-1 [Araneus ventricosus]|uniref:Uncharacterized protein n=1 Tax=Araneus ventricosus TaxID=182803 RepID=A0A4Y2VNS1_ARAVE|nr:hypothetical protein AVEN_117280-1 [Araneus ventricosus]GBO34530.1 hypothetical protein AVEN_91363-1 [Araneus ventricosus]